MEPVLAAQLLLSASGQETVEDAVLWFSEDHPILDGAAGQRIIAALLSLEGPVEGTDSAVASVVRGVASSNFDSSAILVKTEDIPDPRALRRCLDELAYQSPTKTLPGLTPASVESALANEPACMDALASIAGLTPKDLRRRLGDGAPRGTSWALREVKAAMTLINSIVEGTITSNVSGASPARPIELLVGEGAGGGWEQVEEMRVGGVSYETLLAQRVVGTAWGAHRNATSSDLGNVLICALCQELDTLRVPYSRRASRGGASRVPTTGLNNAALETKVPDGEQPWSVIVSIANDSGTANKTAAQLCDLVVGKKNVAVLLAGAGWATRPETVELARLVGGHVYTERDMRALALAISPNSKGQIA